jgi:broad specificity phosphatase PhoE
MYETRTTLLIRHAQASFGSSNYDQLSQIGIEQARKLGRHLKGAHCEFQAVYMGRLLRHRQTLDHILESGLQMPTPQMTSALNEYDSDALIDSLKAGTSQTDSIEKHFKALRQALRLWMSGSIAPKGMPSYAEFKSGLEDLLRSIRSQHDGLVMVVTSGGPIATMIASLIETNPDTTISLNYRIRNASITELAHDAKRHHLVGLNHIDHLVEPGDPKWITYV